MDMTSYTSTNIYECFRVTVFVLRVVLLEDGAVDLKFMEPCIVNVFF